MMESLGLMAIENAYNHQRTIYSADDDKEISIYSLFMKAHREHKNAFEYSNTAKHHEFTGDQQSAIKYHLLAIKRAAIAAGLIAAAIERSQHQINTLKEKGLNHA